MPNAIFHAPQHASLVPFDGSYRVAHALTRLPAESRLRERLARATDELEDLQRTLMAMDRWAVLVVFQGMDAAGKDGTVRAVFNGLNPAGMSVRSFGPPSSEELDHDFIWRVTEHLPQRGRIGVFNRSHYEEVLVVRVHPELLEGQRLPFVPTLDQVWAQRYESIRDWERHLARNGIAIVKFWLNISPEEQRQRFRARLEDPEKYWKFKEADVEESTHWDTYQQAYEAMLNATSRPWAPWYAIPADDKETMRVLVAEILADSLRGLGLEYPAPAMDRSAPSIRSLQEQ